MSHITCCKCGKQGYKYPDEKTGELKCSCGAGSEYFASDEDEEYDFDANEQTYNPGLLESEYIDESSKNMCGFLNDDGLFIDHNTIVEKWSE